MFKNGRITAGFCLSHDDWITNIVVSVAKSFRWFRNKSSRFQEFLFCEHSWGVNGYLCTAFEHMHGQDQTEGLKLGYFYCIILFKVYRVMSLQYSEWAIIFDFTRSSWNAQFQLRSNTQIQRRYGKRLDSWQILTNEKLLQSKSMQITNSRYYLR